MLTVHHLINSRCQRVLWLLEELGVPYELQCYEREPETQMAPKSLEAVHPLGKSPIITDNELTLAESGAIVEYLLGKYGEGRLIPAAGTPEHLSYLYWLHHAEGSATTPQLLKLVFDRIENRPMPFAVRPIVRKVTERAKSTFIVPQLLQHIDYWEAALSKTQWFAGDTFSAADIQMSYPVEVAVVRAGLDAKHPKLMDFLARIHARPAYQQAVERSGGYEIIS